MSEITNQEPTIELKRGRTEYVKDALENGVAIDPNFLDPDLSEAIGRILGGLVEEDTTGIPIDTESGSGEWWDELQIADEDRLVVAEIEKKFAKLACDFADASPGTLRATSELIIYNSHLGMGWHTDNYEPDPDLGTGQMQDLGVLNGVVTLHGEAEYFWKDPADGAVSSVHTKPGMLVLTRSGDLNGLPQIEHKVDSPTTSKRVVLLLKIEPGY